MNRWAFLSSKLKDIVGKIDYACKCTSSVVFIKCLKPSCDSYTGNYKCNSTQKSWHSSFKFMFCLCYKNKEIFFYLKKQNKTTE